MVQQAIFLPAERLLQTCGYLKDGCCTAELRVWGQGRPGLLPCCSTVAPAASCPVLGLPSPPHHTINKAAQPRCGPAWRSEQQKW